MLKVAFKEWARICDALAQGRQSLILRKGGIAEVGGEFLPEHSRFWLYPTFLHQQQSGTKPGFASERILLPEPGRLYLQTYVEVQWVNYARELEPLLALADCHAWTEETVRQRFHYRTPGLYVLAVRVFQLPLPHSVIEKPEFAGCKTWVELDPLPTEGAVPVLSDADAAVQLGHLESLKPRVS